MAPAELGVNKEDRMRNYLLAGAAVIAAGGLLSTGARAQSPVFPVQSTAGKLDGAAPGSVTVTFGGRIFSAVEFEAGTGNNGPSKISSPNLVNYIRLYPSFDYVNPSGIHFGVSMEIRTAGTHQGVGSSTDAFYGFSGVGYVSSDKFGKFAFGTPNSATDQLGVGTGDDFGTGGFYSEYGWVNEAIFVATDAYDGDVPKQKLAYYSPSFAGFTIGASYQPTSVGLNNSGALVDNLPAGGGAGAATGAQSKDRLEIAAQFSHAFGPAALKADVGYVHANRSVVGDVGGYQDVSFFTAGAQGNVAGFELEGSVITGKWAYNYDDSGSPTGPSLDGAGTSTAYIVGIGYATGPFSIGAQYYGVRFDQGDYGATTAAGVLNTGHQGKEDGFAVGGSYSVGPGVSVNFDIATNTTKTPGAFQTESVSGNKVEKTSGTIFGLGTYINW
jgi:hypothetical protein